jgi:hypothetical protein
MEDDTYGSLTTTHDSTSRRGESARRSISPSPGKSRAPPASAERANEIEYEVVCLLEARVVTMLAKECPRFVLLRGDERAGVATVESTHKRAPAACAMDAALEIQFIREVAKRGR